MAIGMTPVNPTGLFTSLPVELNIKLQWTKDQESGQYMPALQFGSISTDVVGKTKQTDSDSVVRTEVISLRMDGATPNVTPEELQTVLSLIRGKVVAYLNDSGVYTAE